MPAPSPMFIPARPRSNGRHGAGSISRSSIEAAEGQPRERIGAAGERRRRRGPDRTASAAWPMAIVLEAHAATTHEREAFQAEAAGDDVDRRAREVIPRLGRARVRDAAAGRRVLILLVADQIARSRAEKHADPTTRSTGRRASRHRPALRLRPPRRIDRSATIAAARAATRRASISAAETSAATRLR